MTKRIIAYGVGVVGSGVTAGAGAGLAAALLSMSAACIPTGNFWWLFIGGFIGGALGYATTQAFFKSN